MEARVRIIDPVTGEHLGTVVFPDSSDRFKYYLLGPDEGHPVRYRLLRIINAMLCRVNRRMRERR